MKNNNYAAEITKTEKIIEALQEITGNESTLAHFEAMHRKGSLAQVVKLVKELQQAAIEDPALAYLLESIDTLTKVQKRAMRNARGLRKLKDDHEEYFLNKELMESELESAGLALANEIHTTRQRAHRLKYVLEQKTNKNIEAGR